jgi:hypothetical protein
MSLSRSLCAQSDIALAGRKRHARECTKFTPPLSVGSQAGASRQPQVSLTAENYQFLNAFPTKNVQCHTLHCATNPALAAIGARMSGASKFLFGFSGFINLSLWLMGNFNSASNGFLFFY